MIVRYGCILAIMLPFAWNGFDRRMEAKLVRTEDTENGDGRWVSSNSAEDIQRGRIERWVLWRPSAESLFRGGTIGPSWRLVF